MTTETVVGGAAFSPKTTTPNLPSSSTANFPFLTLPTEIRLLIYSDLLTRHPIPELSFCPGSPPTTHPQTPTSSSSSIHPAILRTSKAIHREALPILYTDNTFELLCIFGEPGKQHLWQRPASPSPHLFACPNPRAFAFLRRVFLTYVGIGLKRSDVEQFPVCWPEIEREIGQLYPNVESIFLYFHDPYSYSICLKLVRRHKSQRAEADRTQDFMSGVDAQQTREGNAVCYGLGIRHILEDLCTAIAHYESDGQMRNTAFAVQAVRWGCGFQKLYPGWEEFDHGDIYMGCERL
ncbi:MAG: hypothetical protein ASARMPRED_001743 [Alectoria sarmentosa]|nr:MAG: hypothetical protein ASARMPRED_001743 [Alectoria sarmentosa]